MASLRAGFDRERPDFPVGTPFWIDDSFVRSAVQYPLLMDVARQLRSEAPRRGAPAHETTGGAPSSYRDHLYGALFRALILAVRPRQCVELGVLHGFSLLTVAGALRETGEGRIDGYDLFEAYPFTRAAQAGVDERLRRSGLDAWASVHRADARHVAQGFDSIDFLHVDLSNDGDVYRHVFSQWASKVRKLILLEGGSATRDRVEWMLRFGKPPIVATLGALRAAYPEWTIAVLEPYPSMTIAFRSEDLRASRSDTLGVGA